MNIVFDGIDNKASEVSYQFALDALGTGRLTFSGHYRRGSAGNADGDFMTLITDKVLHYKTIKALLVDLRDLEYTWGNTIINVTYRLQAAEIPVAVLYSDACKAIPTIDSRYFFKTENEALRMLNLIK